LHPPRQPRAATVENARRVTVARLASGCGDAIGPLLRELTAVMRKLGLIPVTIERFS
jgi:hypothetical protein